MKKLSKLSYFLTIFLFFSFSAQASFVQVPSSQASDLEIIIKGNQRVDEQLIKDEIDLAGLKKNSIAAINKSLKNLFASDLFLDAKIYQDGQKMIIEVKENPIINDVEFQNNKKINDDILQAEISLKKRSIYTKAKLQADIKRINDIYIKSGRFLAEITPKIIQKKTKSYWCDFWYWRRQKGGD